MNNDTQKDKFRFVEYSADAAERIGYSDYSYWKSVFQNFFKKKSAVVMAGVFFALVIFSFIALSIGKYNYSEAQIMANSSLAFTKPNSEFWFGTDNLGRDLWTRVWAGGRVSLIIAILATLIPEIIGMAVGGISGYLGGWADTVIMRTIDVLMGIPSLIYMILLMVVMGSGNIATLVIAMSITGWMGAARSTRGLVLQLKTREFVVASETLGASSGWIIARRLIPNTLGIRVVSITMSLPSVIFYEAFLSYIGLGVTPPQPSWGQLIKAAGETFRYYPYQFIIPCLCVSITMLCFNLIGDGLRDALDPKLRA